MKYDNTITYMITDLEESHGDIFAFLRNGEELILSGHIVDILKAVIESQLTVSNIVEVNTFILLHILQNEVHSH